MRPNIFKVVTTVLMPMMLLAGGTRVSVAQGVAASPTAAQGAAASASAAPARPGSQPATASVPRGPAQGWAGYRSVQPGTSQPAAKPAKKAPAQTAQVRSGWTGYAPVTAWSSYRPGTARQGTSPGTSRPVNNMARSRVSGPSPYHGNQPRSYREYGSGRAVSVAKPWLPGSP
jgi:hypothetical protein